ncbi:DUF3576 domain-containing protein [Maribius pontilimi]|uniref:DUF3576 domain-containing protein n=1 Tax=Palleronia pontilimi TaxID=1964209 RepID=A0A934MA51_9RHOB|nr:DUF3576 domain-containing protein [Palleronia pontilimi]MBJ3763247.1 DUF3576 domain-containing protein [Palleronia pontilimi]
MAYSKTIAIIALTVAAVATSGCGNRTESDGLIPDRSRDSILRQRANTVAGQPRRETIWDLFSNVDDPDTKIEVNKYIWTAAQQVLDFLPIETADPFSGVIVYGYGRPPGGGPAYRATVYVQDPALDARSLNVALATSGGPVNADTTRAIEDAILTRARQLRLADARL